MSQRLACMGMKVPLPKGATRFFLSVENDRIVVTYDGTNGGKVTRVVTDDADWTQFLISKANEAGVSVAQLSVWASSTLDFPHEFTNNVETITFARRLRSGE